MFGHPSQQSHMMMGVEKALASPKTPAHLKQHLQSRLKGNTMSVHSKVLAPRRGGKTATTPAPRTGSGFAPSFTREPVRPPKQASANMQAGTPRSAIMNDNDGDELPNAQPEAGLAVQKRTGPAMASTSPFARKGKAAGVPKAGKVKRNPLLGIYGGRS